MKVNKLLSIITFTALVLISCKNDSNKSKIPESEVTHEAEISSDIYGNYVSIGYDNRSQGYDWVSVAISDAGDNRLKIKVRSRADKKKPTCTFDATATKVNETTYKSLVDDKTILYVFESGSLTISTENPEFIGSLGFYCSGGASVEDTYTKIDGELDASQIDKTAFSKVLMLQGIGFNVTSIEKDGQNTLTISPFGLELDNSAVTMEINGVVTNAEIEDLDSDGSPDVMVYTKTEDENEYGNVYGVATNNKKSMSFTYFPPISENENINQGYQGHDVFTIVETSLIQRFPIYENEKPTGKMRQVSYKLKLGEAIRGFHVDKVSEY